MSDTVKAIIIQFLLGLILITAVEVVDPEVLPGPFPEERRD